MVKTPSMRQMEARECGAVALGIMLAYYGKYVSLADLRTACGVNREGVTILGIVRAASQYDVRVKVLKRQHIQDIKPPFVIFWNFNHFLVVEAVTPDGIHVNDPAYGRTHLSNALIQRYFSGIVLTFEPTAAFMPMGRAVSWLPPHFFHPYLLVEIGRALLDMGMISALVQQTIHLPALLLIIPYVLLRQWSLNHLSRRYAVVALFDHTLALPFTFFSRYYVDDIASRQIQMHSMGRQHAQALQPFIYGGRVVLYTIGLMLISPAFLFSSALAAISWGAALYGAMRERQIEAAHHIFYDRLASIAFNGVQNIESIKLQGREALYLDQLRHAQVTAYSQPFAGWHLLPTLLPSLNLIALMLFASVLSETGVVSLSNAVIGFCLSLLIVYPATAAGQTFYRVREFKHQLDKINDLGTVSPGTLLAQTPEKGVSLENVSFGYSEKPIIEGIDLQLNAGQSTGVVGRSGSGKSTLVHLVAGLYPAQQGTIKVQSTGIAFVDGQPFLLNATIAENIALFDERISPDDIQKTAHDTDLHHVIVRLPEQYDQVISPLEHPFSKGQLQCLEIARALAQAPSLLLLDEATSAMDAITEARVLQNIARRGCSMLIVSHRLSAVRDCHEIVVIEYGKIVERGTHQTLVANGPVYQQLIAGGVIK